MKSLLFAAVLIATASTGFAAQAPSNEGSTSNQRSGRDPNQVICKRQRELGSRLVIRRDCMTRQEWADHRRRLRANIDHAQNTRVHPRM